MGMTFETCKVSDSKKELELENEKKEVLTENSEMQNKVASEGIHEIGKESTEQSKGKKEEHHEGVLNEAKEVKEEITFNSDQQSVPVKITTTEVGKGECKDSSPKDVLQMINMDESSIKLED